MAMTLRLPSELDAELWRVLYEIDDTKHVVIVLDIRHRAAIYRLRP